MIVQSVDWFGSIVIGGPVEPFLFPLMVHVRLMAHMYASEMFLLIVCMFACFLHIDLLVFE